MLRQIWRAGIAGWPDATLSISVVLALPVVGALERVRPSEVVSLARAMVGRFGHGGVRTSAARPTPSTAPSKFDDHRSDVQQCVASASDTAARGVGRRQWRQTGRRRRTMTPTALTRQRTAPSRGRCAVSPLVIPGVPVSERRHSRVLQQPLAAPRRRRHAPLRRLHARRLGGGVVLRPALHERLHLARARRRPRDRAGRPGAAHATRRAVPDAERQLLVLRHRGGNGRQHAGDRVRNSQAIVECVARCCAFHDWPADEREHAHRRPRRAGRLDGRLHQQPRALGTIGRKVDPTGTRSDGVPIIDITQLRRWSQGGSHDTTAAGRDRAY